MTDHTMHGIVPPYLLDSVAACCEGEAAERAAHTLRVQREMRARREARAALPERGGTAGIIPGALLERLGRSEPDSRIEPEGLRRTPKPPATAARRTVYDARHGSELPGVQVRAEGEPAVADESVNEAYDGLGATWRLFASVYGRDSVDGRGLPLRGTVHFEKGYDNAFWNGEQMVFGDGDGEVFASFTDTVDVIGHELAHGFTQYTAGLVYVAQSGALNESVSDVFGVLTKQFAAGQAAGDADWLIGAGLFMPSVRGVALRSMKAPGTAYDDPRLGRDPQPATMAAYVDLPHDDANDNGGVHINSGIPNHAFYLFAVALGGHAWERAGQVWFDTMTGRLDKDVDFDGFAGATLAAAHNRYGDGDVVDALMRAWTTVGVTPRTPSANPGRHRR